MMPGVKYVMLTGSYASSWEVVYVIIGIDMDIRRDVRII